MNHDDNSNTLTTGYGFEIAVRDIEPGEEITDDYRLFSTYHDTTFKTPPHKIEDITPWSEKIFKEWDRKVQEALKAIEKVEQPLKDFVDSQTYKQVLSFLEDNQNYRSVEEALPLRYKQETQKK